MQSQNVRRTLAFVVCVFFVLAALLFAALALAHSRHTHDGLDPDCPLCAQLTTAGSLSRLFACALWLCAACGAGKGFAVRAACPAPADHLPLLTLVRQGIRMNN